METKPQTSKEYFRTLRIIFIALVAGQVFFALVLLFLSQTADLNAELKDLKLYFLLIVCLGVFGGYLGGKFLFKKTMNAAKDKMNLSDKMNTYRSALIVKYALLEGPSLFALVSFLLTGDWIFLGVTGFIILIFFTLFPTGDKAVRDLDLDPLEERKVLDPEAIIAEIKTE